MQLKIIPIRAGAAHVFLVIQGKVFFLVDAGGKRYASKVAGAIKSRGLELSNLKFIFLTHTHFDHAGCAAELKIMTGTKIIVHQNEADYLRNGNHFIPSGTSFLTKTIAGMGRLLGKAYSGFPSLEPDIVFNQSLSLDNFGVNARIIHTPGHTIGSSCLIIENVLFAGDALFNVRGNIFPPFANDIDLLLKSWELILRENVKWYYPAHGKRFSQDELLKEYLKRTRKS